MPSPDTAWASHYSSLLLMMEDGDLYSKARNYFAAVLVSLTMLAFSATAWADGFYADVHGGTGITWNEGTRVSAEGAPFSLNAHTNYDVGWLAGASAGYNWDWWDQGFATEFEFTFRQNHVDRIASSTPQRSAAIYTAMT